MKGMGVQRAPSGNEWLPTAGINLTATGSSQADAFQIPLGQDFSLFTTVSAGTGTKLPATGVGIPEEYVVANHGANALLVYSGASTAKMGTASAGAGYSLSAGKTGYFTYAGQNNWTVNP